MKHPNYTIEQAEFIAYVKQKVGDFFELYPVAAHGYEHVARVARHAVDIAMHESPDDVFITELAGWLHDIGRVTEHFDPNPDGKGHHELSYELLKQWMKEDVKFYMLTDAEKLELLYAVRYHWNNAADTYTSAVLLRDADKLDGFGDIGLYRLQHFADGDMKKLNNDLRFVYDNLYHVQSARAKEIIKEKQLLEPLEAFYDEFLRSKIESVTLD